jgi:uncharacterized membrane protein
LPRANFHNYDILTEDDMGNDGFEDKMRAETRMKAIEGRLARLETFLNLAKPANAPALPAAVQTPPVTPPAAPPPSPGPKPLPPPQSPLAARQLGGHPGSLLGVVGVICFVLAAGFIIKLSLDSGWLTPPRQIGLAVLFGLGLIITGFSLLDSDSEYASYLPAAGIIVIYAAVFAAHRMYALLPFESAISLSALVTGFCVLIYTKIREDIYPVTAAVGSYFSPAILGLGASSVFAVYYYLLCSIGFAVISIWVKSRALTLVAAYLAMLMTAAAGLTLKADALVASMLAFNFLALSGGVYLYTVQNGTPLNERESATLLPALLFFYATEYYYIDRLLPGVAPWLSLAFAGLLLAFYLAAKRRFPEGRMGSEGLVMTFITVVSFHSFYLELLPADAKPWLFVAIMIVLCCPEVKLRPGAGNAMRVPALGVLAVLLIEFLSMLSHLLSGTGDARLSVALFSVASMWALIVFRCGEIKDGNGYAPLLGAAHLLAVVGLYRLTKDAGSLEVSISWLFYATAVITYAFSRKDEAMARSAVFVLAFAAAKALLYDAAAAPTVVRIVCLLLTGAALYGSGFFLRKIAGWKAEKRAEAAAK